MTRPIQLHDSRKDHFDSPGQNPLPHLLQLPSGLALLELQGTINLPDQMVQEGDTVPITGQTPIGRLVFPGYDPQDKSSTAWMKPIYMYVGKHQRLTGEVKKLPKAVAVIQKKARDSNAGTMDVDEQDEEPVEDLQIVEIVKYKIIFSSRPEPVGVYEGGS
jgi:chromosome transmission fidelity protein 8